MPLREFTCPSGHTIEKYFPTQAASQVPHVRCEEHGRRAKRVPVSRTRFKMMFGSEYGFATDSDRRAWMNNLNVQGWTQDEHTAHRKGAPVKTARASIK